MLFCDFTSPVHCLFYGYNELSQSQKETQNQSCGPDLPLDILEHLPPKKTRNPASKRYLLWRKKECIYLNAKHLNSSSYNKNMKYKFMQEQILQKNRGK